MDVLKSIYNKFLIFSKKYNELYNLIIFVLLCFFVIFVGIHHEPFRDEVQAWNIARDLSIVDIFKQMYSEGHPCLWHLILKPLTMLNLSIYSMTWVSVVIMLITAYLVLFKSPFNKVVRAIIVFSSPFLYFYSVISRSYCLIALIITLLCLVYNKRKDKPLLYGCLLFLLFNTHVMMAGMASILLFFFILETIIDCCKNKKISKNILGCLIGFLGGIVLCLQIFGSYEANSLVDEVGVDKYGYTETTQYIDYFITNYKIEYYYFTDEHLPDNIIFTITAVFVTSILFNLFFCYKETIIFIISYLFSLLLCVMLFYSITSRSVVLIFMLMFLCWVTKEECKSNYKNKILKFLQKYKFSNYFAQVAMLIYCLISIPYGIEAASNDVDLLMTAAPEIGTFITESIDKDDIILSPDENLMTVILGYIPEYSFYSISNERYFTFINWDKNLNFFYEYKDFENVLEKFRNLDNDIYLIHTPDVLTSFGMVVEKLLNDNRLKVVYDGEGEYMYLNSTQEYVKFVIYEVIK